MLSILKCFCVLNILVFLKNHFQNWRNTTKVAHFQNNPYTLYSLVFKPRNYKFHTYNLYSGLHCLFVILMFYLFTTKRNGIHSLRFIVIFATCSNYFRYSCVTFFFKTILLLTSRFGSMCAQRDFSLWNSNTTMHIRWGWFWQRWRLRCR